jgi:hypothetical protein
MIEEEDSGLPVRLVGALGVIVNERVELQVL